MRDFKVVRMFFCIIAALVMLFTGIESVQAATITVTANAPDVLNGANGSCALREAIKNMNDGADTYLDCANTGAAYGTSNTINLPAGTYTNAIAGVGEDLNATGDLDILANVTITGAGAGSSIISGGAIDRVIEVGVGRSVSISGVTIQNGSPTGFDNYGGGISNLGTLSLSNSIVSGNNAADFMGNGGGMFNDGTATITNSTFSGNTAGNNSGAIYNSIGTLTINTSTFSGNSADTGGAIFNNNGVITITTSTFSGNIAVNNAGAILNRNTATITNCTITGNTSQAGFSAVTNDVGSTLSITNSTISGNANGGVRATGGTITISNSIVSGNTAANCVITGGAINSSGYNLASDNTCNLIAGTDIPNSAAANLGALASNGGSTQTMALQAGSAAIDAGDCNGGAITTDQRGTARPQGGACDIGAYEYPAYTVTPSSGAGGTIAPNTPQTINSGSTTTFTVTPNAGYSISSTGGTCGGALVGNTYTTNVITADCTVTASFTLNTYTVTPSAGAGGSINPNTPQTVNYGSTTTFTVTPNAGYSISSTGGTCGGALVGNTYTTNAITADCTVTASFTLNTYTVTPSAGAGGSINPNTPQTVNYGSTTTFTVTPDAGYSISSTGGTCGGNLVGTTYTTNAITADCTVTASFTCSYSISPTSRSFDISGGTGTVSVASGCTWTAASNASWASITSGSSGSGNGTVSFTVAANTGASRTGSLTIAGHSFTITQAGVQYTLVVTKSGTGTGAVNRLYAPNLSFSMFSQLLCGTDCQVALLNYDTGTQVNLYAEPQSGTTFIGWTGGGCSGTGVCTVTLNADTSVNAAFTPISAPITDKATSMIETIGNDIYVNVPIIKYLNTSNSTTTYYSVEFVYVPANDNKVWLKLTKADVLTDISQYSGAQLSQLYQVGSDWRLHLTTIEYNGASIWADLEYIPTNDGALWFAVTGSGEN